MKTAQIKAKIISNKKFKENYGFAKRKANYGFPTYWHLEFESDAIAKNARPGQFVNIKVSGALEPLLRRPISIHRITGAKVKLFYEVIGKGTQILSSRKPGELLDIIGPLGNGFDYQHPIKPGAAKNILVAGGMGVAPLVFLAQRLLPATESLAGGRRYAPRNDTIVLIGAKTKRQILCAPEFKKLGCIVKLATDDGTAGFKGRVTDLLKSLSSVLCLPSSVIYSCGPRLMLKEVSVISLENKISAQLSLEKHMACGIGACLGCVVATKSGYKRVCKDGPVFSRRELIW